MHDMMKGIPSRFTFAHKKAISAFAMKKQDILKFARHNPGIMMKQLFSLKSFD
jgi:hypothetical protein